VWQTAALAAAGRRGKLDAGGVAGSCWQTTALAAGCRRRRGQLLADGSAGSWMQAASRASGGSQQCESAGHRGAYLVASPPVAEQCESAGRTWWRVPLVADGGAPSVLGFLGVGKSSLAQEDGKSGRG
jgi:hypothetical protein